MNSFYQESSRIDSLASAVDETWELIKAFTGAWSFLTTGSSIYLVGRLSRAKAEGRLQLDLDRKIHSKPELAPTTDLSTGGIHFIRVE